MRFLSGLLLALTWSVATLAATPDVAAIIRLLGEKSTRPEIEMARAAVAYERESRIDYLNEEEQVRKQVVRRYLVAPEEGRSVTRLLTVNGKPATDKDEEHRSRARETGEKGRTLSLSEDLLSRYDFTFLGEDHLQGRKAWMLRFKASSNAKTDGFFDRLINAMTGIIWVDAEENQLAKAEIFLARKVSFFGGIAGSIDRLDLTLVQRRVEPNVWLGESTFIDFRGRKLLSDIRFRCYEKCSEFRRLLQAATTAP